MARLLSRVECPPSDLLMCSLHDGELAPQLPSVIENRQRPGAVKGPLARRRNTGLGSGYKCRRGAPRRAPPPAGRAGARGCGPAPAACHGGLRPPIAGLPTSSSDSAHRAKYQADSMTTAQSG
jgi:hypothetical protein